MGVTAADFDRDGYPDIYVANDKTENFLFHNQKDGTFKEIAVPPAWPTGRAAKTLPPWGRSSRISITTARPDLWVSDSKYNRLMRNVGELNSRT